MQLPNCNVESIVQNIKCNKSWTHISKDYNFSNAYRKNKFSDDDIHKICKYFELNGRDCSYKEVLSHIGIDCSCISLTELDRLNIVISGIRTKKNFKHICDLYNY